MKACILTVIKNEHLYLDEWIKYHLDLGIDHIFIFEDIDSDSHKDICDKYGDKVSLNSILFVLDEDSRKEAMEIKTLKKYNVQNFYFLHCLEYLSKLYQDKYNWCFVIDNDEFIFLENDKLKDVLNIFDDYEAFIMHWKCYGANGYVEKPNYENNGVVGTYTKQSTYKTTNNTKICYKLKTFKKEFFYTHHKPTNLCNWCNTNFKKNNFITTYDNIYLKHYITKSWEEYVWKRKIRGYTWGLERDFEFFFKYNPDMLPLKEKLMKDVNDETLVVIPFKQSVSQGNEIKLTLNGWKKYCRFKYRFVVIGEFDEELKNEFPWVKFIYHQCLSKIEGQYTPHLDLQNKFNVIYKLYGKEYNGFIYTCDDYYPIKPFDLNDVKRVHYLSLSFTGVESAPASYWKHDKWKTRQLLDRENLSHINYTIHYPYYFEFNKLNEICKKYNLLKESYVMDDVYFNYFEHENPIQIDTIRLGVWNKSIFENEFQKAIDNPNIKFISNSVEGWSKELENSLESIINEN